MVEVDGEICAVVIIKIEHPPIQPTQSDYIKMCEIAHIGIIKNEGIPPPQPPFLHPTHAN